jgi:hypothetical protein
MWLKKLWRDKSGVEGLPMQLIIIIVIAAAVLAAVLLMIPKGTGNLNAVCISVNNTSGSLFTIDDTGSGETDPVDSFYVIVKVTNDDGKAVSGATVTLIGSHGGGSNVTDESGQANINVSGVKLDANEDIDYMRVEVSASGYNDFEKEKFVTIARVG